MRRSDQEFPEGLREVERSRVFLARKRKDFLLEGRIRRRNRNESNIRKSSSLQMDAKRRLRDRKSPKVILYCLLLSYV